MFEDFTVSEVGGYGKLSGVLMCLRKQWFSNCVRELNKQDTLILSSCVYIYVLYCIYTNNNATEDQHSGNVFIY